MVDPSFRFSHSLRVRWAEIDPQGIVFNPNYLAYFDVAVTEYWRTIGCGYPQVFEQNAVDAFAIKASLEFHRPAVFDDVIELRARVAGMGRSSLRFHLEIERGNDRLVHGEIVYVFADATTRRPTPIPAAFRDAITKFEPVAPEAITRSA